MAGLTLRLEDWSYPEECFKKSDFPTALLLLLKKRENKNKKSELNYIDRCGSYLSNNIKLKLDFLDMKRPRKNKEVQKWLKGKALTSKEKLYISSRSLQVEKQLSFLQWIDLAKKVLTLKNRIKDERRVYQENKKILNSLKKIRSPFWRGWIEISVALNTKNTAWSREIASSLAKFGPYDIFFDSPTNYSKKLNTELASIFTRILNRFEERTSDKLLVKILANKLSNFGTSLELKELGHKFRASWSLTDLRTLGIRELSFLEYFDFWYSKYLNRTSETEILSFLRKTVTPRVLENASISQLWMFTHYLPPGKKIREILISKLAQSWRKGELRDQYIVIRLLEHEPLKRELGLRIPELKKALFQIKRDYFKNLLKSGRANHFALYHLISFGEQNLKHLWWLSL